MAADDSDDERCRALTADGTRCTRPAQEDGYCYQHAPDDETIDENDDETETGKDDPANEDTDEETGMTDDIADTEIGSVRTKVQGVAEELIGRPLVSVVTVESDDEGWRVAVEVIERSSVPDTQDILGRYEISLDGDQEITGYRRTHRYRRDDMDQDI